MSRIGLNSLSVFALLAAMVVGCSPRVSPLYRDFEVQMTISGDEELPERLARAMTAAGWTLTESIVPNVIATEKRTFRSWGLYTVEVELEAAALGNGYARLFVHPYRKYFTGTRRKIPYLKSGLADDVLKDLVAAFEDEGLDYIGSARSRDQQNRERNGG